MKICFSGEELIEVNGENRAISYSVIESEGTFGANYGVRVETDGEFYDAIDLTTRKGEIDAFIELLRRNTVTPATARDVVTDALPLCQNSPIFA